MSRHPDIVEVLEYIFRDAIVEDALALDHLVLFGVEGSRVVLEVLNQCSRLRAFIQDLRLALINAATAAHGEPEGQHGDKVDDAGRAQHIFEPRVP